MLDWLQKIVTLLQADTSDLRELAHLAGADPKTFYRGIRIEDLDIAGQNLAGMKFATDLRPIFDLSDAAVRRMIKNAKKRGYVTWEQIHAVLPDYKITPEQIEDVFAILADMGCNIVDTWADDASDVLGEIKCSKRHEERIAKLLAAILRQRDVGISVLSNYTHDRAKFATWALEHIRNALTNSPKHGLDDQIVIGRLIPKFYAVVYPANRGSLLYYLAMHLAKYQIVSRAIRECLDRPASLYVNLYRAEIEMMLENGRQGGPDSAGATTRNSDRLIS
jgi:hypothetical protein